MSDTGTDDKRAPMGVRGIVSRMPWRYGEIGRRRLAAMARRQAGKGGVDIDDHIRLAIREESAATLGRAGRKLRAAVAALAAFDLARGAGATAARSPLLADAARALWEFVVQREAVGVTDHDLLSQLYGVTPELWRLMGTPDVVCRNAGQAPTGTR